MCALESAPYIQWISNMKKCLRQNARLLIVATLLLPSISQAYIDPNAAGFFYQLISPVIVALTAIWTAFKHKIMGFFRRKKKQDK